MAPRLHQPDLARGGGAVRARRPRRSSVAPAVPAAPGRIRGGALPRARRRRALRGQPAEPGPARRSRALRGRRSTVTSRRPSSPTAPATTASSSTRSPASRCTSRRSSPDLDRPRYRLQRPLLPWLAWAVHPSGGGVGLVYAFLLVGFAALVVGGVSLGAISVTLGGRAWPALAFPLLPGGYVCLRISVADTLSVALALLAIALALRSRWRSAILAGGARGAGQGGRGAPVPRLRPVAARPPQRRAGGDPARGGRGLVGRAPRAPARRRRAGRRDRRAVPRPGEERADSGSRATSCSVPRRSS